MLEQETRYRQLSQEQLENFTLDMNTAYARLKGMEEAIDSKIRTHTHTHTTFWNKKSQNTFVMNHIDLDLMILSDPYWGKIQYIHLVLC